MLQKIIWDLPFGKVIKSVKAMLQLLKNYLTETEIEALNRIVTMYLDYAEDQAERINVMHMKDWEEKLNVFLKFNNRDILDNAGSISQEVAKELALEVYKKFNQHRLEKKKKDDFDNYLEDHGWTHIK